MLSKKSRRPEAGDDEEPALFYEFSLDRHVPQDHLLRAVDRFVDLGSIRAHLASFCSSIGRPWVDPELMSGNLGD